MNKPINRHRLNDFALRWQLTPDGEPFATHSSVLLPALRDGRPVMLKLTPEPDEIRGGGLLQSWQGRGAVRVLERAGDAILMERPTGPRSLLDMSSNGRDPETIDILCAVANELHRPNPAPLPPLEPVDTLFSELLTTDWDDPLVQTGKRYAFELLDAPIDQGPLHGDIQHYNVLDAGNGCWLAIDPKGQFGERTYDFANLFRNPITAFAAAPDVVERRLAQIASNSEIDPQRLRRWIVAFCSLCLVWDYYPQGSANDDRRLAEIVLAGY